jgi:isopenicillin N synthase-like dioxygenase
MAPAGELPVVDLAPFRADPTSPAGEATVATLRAACHEVGFAHLIGHGIGLELDDAVHDVARRFFALPEPQRLEIVNTNSP